MKKICTLFVLTFALLSLLSYSPTLRKADAQNQQLDLPAGSYVPNEFVVRYKENNNPEAIQEHVAIRAERAETAMGFAQNIQEDVVFTLTGKDSPEEALARIQSVQSEIGVVSTQTAESDEEFHVYKTDGTEDVSDVIEALESNPEVEFAEPNFIYRAFTVPNDTDYAKLWGMKNIKMEEAWDETTGATTVTVAVIDTGIEVGHPDLQGNAVKSEEHLPSGRCVPNGDGNGHGTHVAGIIGAVGNNVAGIAGVNWQVKLNGYCVLDSSGAGTTQSIKNGLEAAIRDNVDVINMSLGGPGNSTEIQRLIQEAVGKGITVVVAAGNCGGKPGSVGNPTNDNECPYGEDVSGYYPAALTEVITVASCGPQKEHSKFSNVGSAVDICAPGGNPTGGSTTCKADASDCIRSSWKGSRYLNVAGTSQASPHVAGVAALLTAINPNLTPQQIQTILEGSADDLGDSGKDSTFGAGHLNAQSAINSLKSSNIPSSPPQVSVTISPSPGNDHPCPDKAANGDYDCNDTVNESDVTLFQNNFRRGIADFIYWEHIRKAFYPGN